MIRVDNSNKLTVKIGPRVASRVVFDGNWPDTKFDGLQVGHNCQIVPEEVLSQGAASFVHYPNIAIG
jgi:hypothetical protein